MCGITGYININHKSIGDTSVILNMLRAQKHRGPDDAGIRLFSLREGNSAEKEAQKPLNVEGNYEGVLGFNRLSILDLSINGHQPMISPDGKILLALNGEIYNAFDYKNELQKWGYKFKSTTDTEIILALYLRYGLEEMLDRLNGMFAIVIIDLNKRGIFIIRDRFGIKPMYYISNDEILAFSSELKSFRYIDNFAFHLAEEKLDEYLLFRNNLHGTLFQHVESLGPGHFISYTIEDGLVLKSFFNVNNYIRSHSTTEGFDTYIENLEEWLGSSVKSQLISDVKLGCQLSGGIDSSLVTWLANRNSERGNFEAVSIIFNDPRFSEEIYINKVSEDLGIVSHKFLLDSNYYLDNIEKATWHLESPINHPNTIAIYELSQRAKEFVTVLLSGEGADEVFGGYERFYEIRYPYQARMLLHEMKRNFIHPLSLFRYFDHGERAMMATSYMTPIMAEKVRDGFSYEMATKDRRSLYKSLSGSVLDRQVKYEMLSYLPDLLIRQDKMSMAHSIENRVPFLDNEVVKNSFTIPEEYLLIRKSPEGYNNEKYLLKKMAANKFGNDFAFRRKMGFGIPVKEFFLNYRFVDYLNDKVLSDLKKRQLFDYRIISKWITNIKTLDANALGALWMVVAFEIWASLYLDCNYEDRYPR